MWCGLSENSERGRHPRLPPLEVVKVGTQKTKYGVERKNYDTAVDSRECRPGGHLRRIYEPGGHETRPIQSFIQCPHPTQRLTSLSHRRVPNAISVRLPVWKMKKTPMQSILFISYVSTPKKGIHKFISLRLWSHWDFAISFSRSNCAFGNTQLKRSFFPRASLAITSDQSNCRAEHTASPRHRLAFRNQPTFRETTSVLN